MMPSCHRPPGARSVVALAVAAGLSLAPVSPQARAEPATRALPSDATAPLYSEGPGAAALSPDAPVSMRAFADLARALSPAVVNVHVTRAGGGRSLFGLPEGTGQGSGFIIRADGLVLTNHHVVRDAGAIRVRLVDETEFEARVVGAFAPLDVALLKIEAAAPLPVAPLGDARPLEIGEWVIAIGNPFGLHHTVTAGIVSAKGRRDVVPAGREPNMAPFIQTDASINPGNSGGPLINIRGEVVGINTAINAAGQGIGFAVPIDMVKTILPQLARGRVERSFLGLRFGPVPAEVRQKRPELRRAAQVREVIAGGPAARAGLLEGDVITRWHGAPLRDWEEVAWLAATTGAGREVAMGVLRGGKDLELRVKLERFPEEGEATGPRAGRGAGAAGGDDARGTDRPAGAAELGLTLRPPTASEAKRAGVAAGVGVLVATVAPATPAAILGMAPGDLVVTVNRTEVRGGVAGFEALVAKVAPGELLAFGIKRGDRVLMKAFTR